MARRKVDMSVPSQANNEAPPSAASPGQWSNLESIGDVRRMLRWCILGTATNQLDLKKAGVMGQLGLYLLKAMEIELAEHRLSALELRLEEAEGRATAYAYTKETSTSEPSTSTQTH